MSRLLMLARLLWPGRSVPIVQAALCAAATVVLIGLLRPDLLGPGVETSFEGHSIVSMDLAMSRAFCGTPSALTPLVSVTTEVSKNGELATIPARQIAAERAGSLQRFCETSTEPRVNNENSLMWLESWLFTIRPNASIYEMGQLLHGIRIAAATLALALMLSQGVGLLAGIVTYLWLLILLQDLHFYVHAAYPFLPILLVLTATAYTAAALNGWTREPRRAAIVALAAGSWTAFAVNMRTSHMPVYLALTGLMFAIGQCRTTPTALTKRLQQFAIAAALFGTGYGGFQYLAITRYLPHRIDGFTRHTIAHPLVLSLGVPESDFSRREGIAWSDPVGLQIARRMDPQVGYLDTGYERALFAYYSGLWSANPREMIQVYLTKSRAAGKQMLMVLRGRLGKEGTLISYVLSPLDRLPNGIYIMVLYAVIAAAATRAACRVASRFATLLALLAVAAWLLHVEASVIMSNYVVNYHAYLAFSAVFISIALPAWAVGWVWDRVQPRAVNE